MAQTGFLEQKPRSPGSLAIVVALHGAAISALMLAKMEYERVPTVITKAYEVKPDEPPPPEKIEPVEPKQQAKSRIETVTPLIKAPVMHNLEIPEPKVGDPAPFIIPSIGRGEVAVPADPPLPPPPPPAPPVREEASIDPRARLQPAYPPAEERAAVEGSVTVSVLIGTDGRVKRVEKVRAATDAFFRATEQQALRHWRFKPATVDGKPVESRKTMTVHFRLDA
jgi:protein TonB